MHALAEIDNMPKGLKIKNRTGITFFDSSWTAGVDYDPDLHEFSYDLDSHEFEESKENSSNLISESSDTESDTDSNSESDSDEDSQESQDSEEEEEHYNHNDLAEALTPNANFNSNPVSPNATEIIEDDDGNSSDNGEEVTNENANDNDNVEGVTDDNNQATSARPRRGPKPMDRLVPCVLHV